ncbi:MAG: ribonuclease HII [Patescibacteria group bacterium]
MQKLQKTPKKSFKYLIGIDEVGRGPVAGPVAVCTSIIRFDEVRKKTQRIKDLFRGRQESSSLPKLRDSKRLSEAGRESWFSHLVRNENKPVISFSLSYASAKEIDKRGIAVCIKSLINRNLRKLHKEIKFSFDDVLVLLDGGLKAPDDFLYQETIVGGDDKEPIISFASIYAKVSRDRLMCRLGKKYPQYGLSKHKGYGTREHFDAIKSFGPIYIHRLTFIKSLL